MFRVNYRSMTLLYNINLISKYINNYNKLSFISLRWHGQSGYGHNNIGVHLFDNGNNKKLGDQSNSSWMQQSGKVIFKNCFEILSWLRLDSVLLVKVQATDLGIIGHFCHSVYVITFSLAQSDHIMRLFHDNYL